VVGCSIVVKVNDRIMQDLGLFFIKNNFTKLRQRLESSSTMYLTTRTCKFETQSLPTYVYLDLTFMDP